MGHGNGVHGNPLYSLIPLEDFKALLGIDDREDVLSRFCLTTVTYAIEQYCKRRLLRKKRFEFLSFYGGYIFPLRDYPVREVLAVYQTHALKENPTPGGMVDRVELARKKYLWSIISTPLNTVNF
jgi:hypothetical protein